MSKGDAGILAIDQGTTSSRAIVFALDGSVIAVAQEEFPQIYPEPGWVEHDPETIWKTTVSTAKAALNQAKKKKTKVAAIGVTNQRETTVVWDRKTGRALHNAIVWQDRRTSEICAGLASAGHEAMVSERTGLVLDPYFSATKIAWILDHVDGARARAERGELAFGTIDAFLIWRLTGGRVHATDATNASRTSLYALASGEWDDELLGVFNVPASVLPEVRDCAGPFGEVEKSVLGQALPITGVAGDQQAAGIGQACLSPGEAKCTYGTGAFLILNTGTEIVHSNNRLLSTVAYRLAGRSSYALEGSILSAGSTIQWLRDGLGIIASAPEVEALAAQAEDAGGVTLVPAFTGLGAPYWDADARGALVGLTRGSGRAEIARAALESTAHQTRDLLDAMARDGIDTSVLRADGGMTANALLMQILSDTLGVEVVRPVITETTAWGAACVAGVGAGLFGSLEDTAKTWRADRSFSPAIDDEERTRGRDGWRSAVERITTNAPSA